MGTVSNIKIETMNVTWGSDVAQVQTITCVADVADSLGGKYGFIYTALNALKHHFWFNTSGGSAVDPNPGGSTAVEVAIATNATASAVATALAAALEALPGYTASANGAVVTVTNAASGYASAAHEGVGTVFSFAVSTEGDSAADIGYIDGDIEISMEEDLVDVTAHQKGTNVLSQIRTGKQVEMTVGIYTPRDHLRPRSDRIHATDVQPDRPDTCKWFVACHTDQFSSHPVYRFRPFLST